MNRNIKKVLVDTDGLVYRVGFAADSQARRELDNPEKDDYLEWALGNARTTIEGILSRFPDYEEARFYLSGSGNFRDKVASILPYKGNRDAKHKPKYFKETREYLKDVWGAKEVEGMEADDQLGIDQWAYPDKSTCIVSTDKDMGTLPGWRYIWTKDEFIYTKLNDANIFFYRQMLEGDRVDNIPGIRGVGPKTVDKLLSECAGDSAKVKEKVQEYYKKQYGLKWEEAYHEIATLLFILRESNKGYQDYGL
jgi:hypothetical protein